MLIKLEWLGYRMFKIYGNILSRFHLKPERHGQTELLYQYRASVCWCTIKTITQEYFSVTGSSPKLRKSHKTVVVVVKGSLLAHIVLTSSKCIYNAQILLTLFGIFVIHGVHPDLHTKINDRNSYRETKRQRDGQTCFSSLIQRSSSW